MLELGGWGERQREKEGSVGRLATCWERLVDLNGWVDLSAFTQPQSLSSKQPGAVSRAPLPMYMGPLLAQSSSAQTID